MAPGHFESHETLILLMFVLADSHPGCVQDTGSYRPPVAPGTRVFKAFAVLSRRVLRVPPSGQSGLSCVRFSKCSA